MHPASVNFNVGRFESPWLLYTDLTETSKVFCREASMAPIYSLLLFGGQISIDHEKSLLRLDGWASFKAPARIAVLVSVSSVCSVQNTWVAMHCPQTGGI